MNKIILCGRLTRDPEVRYSENNTCIARFSLAVDRITKKDGQPSADFFRCVALGKSGEFAEKYLKKGTKMLIEGRVQNGSYEKDGTTYYTSDVIIERMEFAGARTDSGSGAAGAEAPSEGGFLSLPDTVDELPFE